MSSPRILYAGLYHESNTFASGRAELAAFSFADAESLANLTDDGSPTGAFFSFAKERGWTLIPAFDLRTMPGPTASAEVLDFAMDNWKASLARAGDLGIDAVFLILHGAMVAENCEDVEGLLLTELRKATDGQDIPVAAVLDLHANVSADMVTHCDILVSYRRNPHTDAVEATLRTAALLERSLRDRIKFRTSLLPTPYLFPPTGTGTADEPMKGLVRIAECFESDTVPAINFCPGFAHADTPFTGMTFSFVHQPGAEAEKTIHKAAVEFFHHLEHHASEGIPAEWDLDAAIASTREHSGRPVLLVEPADNIGGGAPGDATWVFHALLKSGNRLRTGLILNDPVAAAAFMEVPIGGEAAIPLCGSLPELCGPAIKLPWRVENKSDGVFEVEDRNSHIVAGYGTVISMGPTVLISHKNYQILVTSKRTPPMDLGQWKCGKINAADFELIVVKAAVAHRQAYDKISSSSLTVSTPGSCTSHLELLPYEKLRRPIFPLDSIQTPTPNLINL